MHRKKYRMQEAVFLVEGEKMVAELLRGHQDMVVEIFAIEEWFKQYQGLCRGLKQPSHQVSAATLKKISTFTTPNKVVAVVRQFSKDIDFSHASEQLSLYLDGIQDPGNMGTILRIADWFGIPYVFCAANTVELYNPKVVQASMGAIFRVQTMTISLLTLKNACPDLPIYGTLLNGDDIFKTPLDSKGIIVIGNEGKGISAEAQELLTHRITIPSFAKNGAESLNVGVATGIVCAMFKKN